MRYQQIVMLYKIGRQLSWVQYRGTPTQLCCKQVRPLQGRVLFSHTLFKLKCTDACQDSTSTSGPIAHLTSKFTIATQPPAAIFHACWRLVVSFLFEQSTAAWTCEGCYCMQLPGDREEPTHLISASAALANFYPLVKVTMHGGMLLICYETWQRQHPSPISNQKCTYHCYQNNAFFTAQ